MTTVRVVPRPRIRPRARSSRSPVPSPARARATVGAPASTKSRDGDTSTGHDSSLSSVIHRPSSIRPPSTMSSDGLHQSPVVTRHAVPIAHASHVMSSSSDRLDRSTRPIDRRTFPDRLSDDSSTPSTVPRGWGDRARRSVRAFVASVVRRVGRSSRRSSCRRVVASSPDSSSTSPVRSSARRRDGTGRDWRMTMDRATTSMRATSSTSATSGWRRRGGEGGGNGRGRDAHRRGPRPRGRAMGARRKVRRSKDGGETRTRAPGGEEARREGGARRGDDARGRESERDASG